MFKKLTLTAVFIFTARTALAVTIDLPAYEFADIARSAVLTAPGEGVFVNNYASAEDDITDAYATTYVYGRGANAIIDLDFGTDVYSGRGFDISIFFVGGGAQGHIFGLSLPDNPGAYPDAIHFDSTTYQHYQHTGFNLAGNAYSIFRMDIDLDQYGTLGASPIGRLSLDVGNSSAAPSLIGAYHLQPAAVVPLPLPIVLFGSGLALLGFIGRRNRS